MAIGTLFTLFVLPAIYVLIAAQHIPQTEDEQAPVLAHP
jgi:uncharacterized membrane protein (DUF485 family)